MPPARPHPRAHGTPRPRFGLAIGRPVGMSFVCLGLFTARPSRRRSLGEGLQPSRTPAFFRAERLRRLLRRRDAARARWDASRPARAAAWSVEPALRPALPASHGAGASPVCTAPSGSPCEAASFAVPVGRRWASPSCRSFRPLACSARGRSIRRPRRRGARARRPPASNILLPSSATRHTGDHAPAPLTATLLSAFGPAA